MARPRRVPHDDGRRDARRVLALRARESSRGFRFGSRERNAQISARIRKLDPHVPRD